MNNPIDIVITWVDGSDPIWLEKKNKALIECNGRGIDARKRRFRDWNNLVYLFRGIAKYAPWVNHIYLVTPNQCPSWLNTNNPKITLVNQDDLFEDKTILPTFNNCAVELLFHKIPGLSEQFVYLNDDMFFVGKAKEEMFFKNGLPCVTAAISPILPHYVDGKGTYGNDVMNYSVVAKHFNKQEILKNSNHKFFNLKNGREIIKTLCCVPFNALPGFNDLHIAYSFLKETYYEVWAAEPDILSNSCKYRFRNEFSLYHGVMRYWQMASGSFEVRPRSFSKMFDLYKRGDELGAIKCINKGHPTMICINDNIMDDDFDYIANSVNSAFMKAFPDKCEFEM